MRFCCLSCRGLRIRLSEDVPVLASVHGGSLQVLLYVLVLENLPFVGAVVSDGRCRERRH